MLTLTVYIISAQDGVRKQTKGDVCISANLLTPGK